MSGVSGWATALSVTAYKGRRIAATWACMVCRICMGPPCDTNTRNHSSAGGTLLDRGYSGWNRAIGKRRHGVAVYDALAGQSTENMASSIRTTATMSCQRSEERRVAKG